MHISFATPVECSDGPCGRCVRLMVDLDSQQVTHIIVEQNVPAHTLQLVPFEQVAGTSMQLVQLRCSIQELRTMPDLSTLKLASLPAHGGNIYSTPSIVYLPQDLSLNGVPHDIAVVIADMSVETRREYIGRLVGIEVNGSNGRIRYLTIDRDQVQDPHEVICPVQEIESISADCIYLNKERI